MRCVALRRVATTEEEEAQDVLAKEKEEESERCRAIITAVEFRVPVSRDTRRTEEIEMRAGRIGNEIRRFGCRMLSIGTWKLGRLTVKFVPRHENPLYIAALGVGTSDKPRESPDARSIRAVGRLNKYL